jgi:hypothetical protein
MKRAARHKTGSVVFDKRRRTWNFLWWEGGKRRSRSIGTARQYPTKASAWSAAAALRESLERQVKVINKHDYSLHKNNLICYAVRGAAYAS